MKRKAIEKIPYLTGIKCQDRKKKFVAAVGIKTINHENHLFLEIYENKKEKLKVPQMRFVYTKKDWSHYYPKEKVWSAAKIEDEYGRLRWTPAMGDNKKDTFISDENIRKIANFSKKKIWEQSRWWEYITRLEGKIKFDKWKAKMAKQQARLDERCKSVPDVPKEFENWYKNVLFQNINYIYYKRKGRFAAFTCSHCGESYTSATKRRDTFESQFEHIVEVPRAGNKAKCEMCHTEGTYKTAGTMKEVYGIEKMCYVGQPYKDRGAMIRYFEIEKILAFGRKEKFVCTEIARNFFEEGKERIKDYYLYNGYTGKEGWCDHNIGGMGEKIQQEAAAVYQGTFEDLTGTILQYSGLKEYIESCGTTNAADYMEKYLEYPYIEMFSKMGMYHAVKNMLQCGIRSIIQNRYASKPEELLGIKKERIPLLIRHNGDINLIKVCQEEIKQKARWKEEQCIKLMEIEPNWGQLEIALSYMTLQQYINRVEKYSGVKIENLPGCAAEQLRKTSITYLDYLCMRNELGYDMTNSIIQHPRNLNTAHGEMILERNKEEMDNRLAEVKLKYPNIKKSYRSLRNRYFFEDETLMIRPARSAEEIVMEGRTLHHCVGGNDYLKKHDSGKSIILMLRFKNNQEMPYITVEIEDMHILQWYGEHDKKPNRKEIQKWLDAYIIRLQCQGKEAHEAAGRQGEQQALLYA